MKEAFEKIVFVSPAYDKRNSVPSKDYGIRACRIAFALKGKRGAIQFMIGTDWHVPSAREHLTHFSSGDRNRPEGWDVGYHAYKPQYKGQSSMSKCHILGCDCYRDGSGVIADAWMEDFIAGGTEWLWPKMEETYRERFGRKKRIKTTKG